MMVDYKENERLERPKMIKVWIILGNDDTKWVWCPKEKDFRGPLLHPILSSKYDNFQEEIYFLTKTAAEVEAERALQITTVPFVTIKQVYKRV